VNPFDEAMQNGASAGEKPMTGQFSRLSARPGSLSHASEGRRAEGGGIETLDRPPGAIYNRAHV